ncbi:MAG: hypothetical protein LKJ25_08675 [Clostridia bacterium]|nr:hypothetical protein [Clostridia bacterium]
MKFIENGVEYVSGMETVEVFYLSCASCLASYRKQGLPFYTFDKKTKKKYNAYNRSKYFYPIKKCQKWFAGEE